VSRQSPLDGGIVERRLREELPFDELLRGGRPQLEAKSA